MTDEPLAAKEDISRDRPRWKRVARRLQRFLAQGYWPGEAWVQYGYALKNAGDLRTAAHAYAMALTLQADSLSDAHLLAGALHEAQGDRQRALISYKYALKFNPHNTDAANELRALGTQDDEVASIVEGAKEDRRFIGLHPADSALAANRRFPMVGRRWNRVLAAVIVLILLCGAALMLADPPEIAQAVYRSAQADAQRKTAEEKAQAEATARKAAEEKVAVEAAARKAAEQRVLVEVAAREAAQDARRKLEDAARNAATLQGQPTLARPPDEAKLDLRQQAEKAEVDLNLSEQDRKKVQVELNSLGHEMPTASGYFGPRTRAMIKAWQKEQGRAETGYLDASQLAVLHEQASQTKHSNETKLDPRQQAEKAEADLNLSEQDRKRVQVALNSLGHEFPTVTGYFGPRTRAMVAAWQKVQGLPETGFLSADQLATLQQQAAPALEKYDQAQTNRAKLSP